MSSQGSATDPAPETAANIAPETAPEARPESALGVTPITTDERRARAAELMRHLTGDRLGAVCVHFRLTVAGRDIGPFARERTVAGGDTGVGRSGSTGVRPHVPAVGSGPGTTAGPGWVTRAPSVAQGC